jgi:hypothetical protein
MFNIRACPELYVNSFDQTDSVLYDPMLLRFQVPELTEAK